MKPTIIPLPEYQSISLPLTSLPTEVGQQLWQTYGKEVTVDEPSFKNGNRWQLTNQGWAGYIPLTPQYHFRLEPKLPIGNLFRMLLTVYQLDEVRWLEGLMLSDSLPEFFEQLAMALLRRITHRQRQGVQRAYLPQRAALPYLRGRLDVTTALRQPTVLRLPCHYDEQTADIPDNQILLWTVYQLARSGLCGAQTRQALRQCYHALARSITLTPYTANDCVGRSYHRLNEDYRPMHALCRFFLEANGPMHHQGDKAMLPFLVDMARLYEQFVAQWLRHYFEAHPPLGWQLYQQEHVPLEAWGRSFNIDLLIRARATGQVVWVLDTKYKRATTADDLQQVVAYAEAKRAILAGLVYPQKLPQTHPQIIGDIQVYPLTFELAGDLDHAGKALMEQLQQALPTISVLR